MKTLSAALASLLLVTGCVSPTAQSCVVVKEDGDRVQIESDEPSDDEVCDSTDGANKGR